MVKIAAITTVRNGGKFLSKWVNYYAAELGPENLTIVVDGFDQEIGGLPASCQILQQEYVAHSRIRGDKVRASVASRIAAQKLRDYDCVIGTDIDEFIVVDPAMASGLRDYISSTNFDGSLAALGIDVVPHPIEERSLDWDQKYLGQRQYGIISDRYTKASFLNQPLSWGSGFHRVRGRRTKIDPNLYLFHTGSIDQSELDRRSRDPDRITSGWVKHQLRRGKAVLEFDQACVLDGDDRFDTARKELSRPRSVLAWNKPRPLSSDRLIRIPERFFGKV